MGLPLASYFHYFGPAVAHSRFSTYYPWVCFFSLSGPIQTRLLPHNPLYESVSHSFLPLGFNGFFLLSNSNLPMLLGFFSYWACQNEPQQNIYIYIYNVNNEGFSWSVKTNQQLTNNKKIHKWFEKSNSSPENKSKLFPFSTQILPISVGCLWVGENFTFQFIFISFIYLFLSRYFQCTWVGSIFRHTWAKLFARKYSKYS